MNYNNLTLHHFENAAQAGVLRGGDRHRGAAGSRGQGTWVQFDLDIDPGDGCVRAARFLAYGCPHVIAVADWLAQQAVGRPASPALPENVESLRRRFELPIDKLGRLLVVEDAWIAAVSSPFSSESA